jgi:hypothetical protein
MIFGIGADMPKTVDLPAKIKFASIKVRGDQSFNDFDTKAEAENDAKKWAQREDCLYAVYEIRLIGSAAPSASTYQEIK